MLYLTGGKDELVTGQICLITEDVWLFHVELLCDPHKPEEMIVYCHSGNSLKDIICLCFHSGPQYEHRIPCIVSSMFLSLYE